MGKTFTHPQPHWLPLHELPFQFPESKTAHEAATNEEAFLLLLASSRSDIMKDRCNKLRHNFKINNGVRFTEVDCENKCLIFEYNDPIYGGQRSEFEAIRVDIGIVTNQHHFSSGYLFGLGVDIYPYVKAIWEAAVDHFLDEMPTGFVIWARPGSPRTDFVRIEASSIKFYATRDIVSGIMVCDGTEKLFDVHFAPTKPPETALASEERAIDFAAAELKKNPDMSKDDLRTALGTSYLAHISDRRMNSWIWPEARARAGLDKRARAGRKPGKSKR